MQRGLVGSEMCIRDRYNDWAIQILLIICGIINMPNRKTEIERDHKQRLLECIQLLSQPDIALQNEFLNSVKEMTKYITQTTEKQETDEIDIISPITHMSQPDSGLAFRQFPTLKTSAKQKNDEKKKKKKKSTLR
eukprot:TRINITY_DN2918_c0_g1_i5.p2 TRINITY_DN2918_c0_g1~~TRINITY_DN2918_c0_g1_i5.p2  ORF type:complete len:135 (-),score=37.69 TRINITY_DN2918_c0_g1_i5:3-407(-)